MNQSCMRSLSLLSVSSWARPQLQSWRSISSYASSTRTQTPRKGPIGNRCTSIFTSGICRRVRKENEGAQGDPVREIRACHQPRRLALSCNPFDELQSVHQYQTPSFAFISPLHNFDKSISHLDLYISDFQMPFNDCRFLITGSATVEFVLVDIRPYRFYFIHILAESSPVFIAASQHKILTFSSNRLRF